MSRQARVSCVSASPCFWIDIHRPGLQPKPKTGPGRTASCKIFGRRSGPKALQGLPIAAFQAGSAFGKSRPAQVRSRPSTIRRYRNVRSLGLRWSPARDSKFAMFVRDRSQLEVPSILPHRLTSLSAEDDPVRLYPVFHIERPVRCGPVRPVFAAYLKRPICRLCSSCIQLSS
jgi:hypothetical protein